MICYFIFLLTIFIFSRAFLRKKVDLRVSEERAIYNMWLDTVYLQGVGPVFVAHVDEKTVRVFWRDESGTYHATDYPIAKEEREVL